MVLGLVLAEADPATARRHPRPCPPDRLASRPDRPALSDGHLRRPRAGAGHCPRTRPERRLSKRTGRGEGGNRRRAEIISAAGDGRRRHNARHVGNGVCWRNKMNCIMKKYVLSWRRSWYPPQFMRNSCPASSRCCASGRRGEPAPQQAPVFVDQFDPGRFNAAPTFTVPFPRTARTLCFSTPRGDRRDFDPLADRRLLALAGYGGVNLLEKPGTPSLLDIQRGFATVDAAGTVHTFLYAI